MIGFLEWLWSAVRELLYVGIFFALWAIHAELRRIANWLHRESSKKRRVDLLRNLTGMQ